jgi:NAD(P)-dependent dehydrogenase (short-subunit alcohol dehydrogenase family)
VSLKKNGLVVAPCTRLLVRPRITFEIECHTWPDQHKPWALRSVFPTQRGQIRGQRVRACAVSITPQMAKALRVSSLFGVAGKSVLVTGGGRGIGKMIAEGFVANGSTVYISSRDQTTLEATADELTAAHSSDGGGCCVAVPGNLYTRAGCEELAATMGGLVPDGLHVLVNNSGVSWAEPLDRTSGQRSNWGWDRVLDLNVKAPFYLTRALLPALRRAAAPADPARVVMIGSVAGVHHQSLPTHAYDASKAALHSLTRKLAYDLAREAAAAADGSGEGEAGGRVTANAIAPGFIRTKMTAGLALDKLEQVVPLGRMGEGSDIAGAAIFLASPAAAWISGAILPVDGGILTQPLDLGGV